MSALIDFLIAFNRKERFLLIGTALGNSSFLLSAEYRTNLKKAVGLKIPSIAFAAMDYHFTWLYAAVVLAELGETPKTALHRVLDNAEGIVRGNQEDIDLLIVFDAEDTTHIIAVEAKGVIGFTNRQMASKADRLKEIFGENGDLHPNVSPHFVLTSPKESRNLSSKGWPAWMTPNGHIPWVELAIPPGLLRVSRSNAAGKASAQGKHWTILRS